ncbi:MAG: hypothetical protein ACE367_25320 [Acidimicrobiales bacterium]
MAGFLIRRAGEPWTSPAVTAYDDEAALQTLLETSPELLPVDEPIMLVREFWIPTIGAADLVGITASGEIVIVECKLRANPQIRREVVGQTLAYAGGIWRLGRDGFRDQFESKATKSIVSALVDLGSTDVAAASAAIDDAVERGQFRLIIAVDDITAELRTIVEFLNARTEGFEIVALELRYSRQDDLEILVPQVYGAEVAETKRAAAGKATQKHSIDDVLAAFDDPAISDLRPIADRLIAHARANGAEFKGGTGKYPAASCYFPIDGAPASCWALYIRPGPKIDLSFGSIANRSPELAVRFLELLKPVPGFEVLTSYSADSMPSYPPVQLVGLNDESVTAFLHALDAIRDS